MHDFDRIAALENQVEAGLLESILKEREIPVSIRCYHDMAYDGLFQLQQGWGAVYAPIEYKDEIMEILHELRSE